MGDQSKDSPPAVIRVVIVDDDEAGRGLIGRMLAPEKGIEIVASFADGASALAGIASVGADVALVDIAMPGMSGVDLTRRLRRACPHVHVLALTSLTDEETVADMRAAGAVGLLFKDSSHDVLAQAIRSAHLGLTVLSPGVRSQPAPRRIPPDLSSDEATLLGLACDGLTNEQIATRMHVSPSWVKQHLTRLQRKLRVTNRTTLVARAIELNLL